MSFVLRVFYSISGELQFEVGLQLPLIQQYISPVAATGYKRYWNRSVRPNRSCNFKEAP